jgi:hypothetical protein
MLKPGLKARVKFGKQPEPCKGDTKPETFL